MKKVAGLLVLFALSACGVAQAKPQVVSWALPTQDCDGIALAQADLMSFELIYSLTEMPMPSDTAGPCGATEDPEAPAGAITVPVPLTETSVLLNLQPGQTYYFRARVSAYVDGNWSNWSVQISKTVPYGRPDRVIVSDGNPLNHLTFEVVTDPPIKLQWSKGG